MSITTTTVSVFDASGEDTARIESQMSLLCASLEKIIIGLDAQKILDAGNIADASSLVVLPAWSWQHPSISVGRKSQVSGGRVMMPVRISWTSGSVVVVPAGSSHLFSYNLCGLGNTGSGTTTIGNANAAASVLRTVDCIDGQRLPSSFEARVGTRSSVLHQLRKLAEEGKNEKWMLLERMNDWSFSLFGKAAGAVAHEIRGEADRNGNLTDPHLLEQLRQKFILGEQDDEDSAAFRLIDRCLLGDTFAKVDPIKYVTMSIRENAERAIRVAIDDPRTGRKVRTLSRELGITDVNELLDAYCVFYPKERTGKNLIVRAMRPVDTNATDIDEAFETLTADIYGNPVY